MPHVPSSAMRGIFLISSKYAENQPLGKPLGVLYDFSHAYIKGVRASYFCKQGIEKRIYLRLSMEGGMAWASWGSVLASFMLLFTTDYLPFSPRSLLMKASHRLFDLLYPYAEIRIDEMGQEHWYRSTSKIFELVTVYLAANTSKSARKMRANLDKDTENLTLSMDEHQQIRDQFQGVTVWWSSNTTSSPSFPFFYRQPEDRR